MQRVIGVTFTAYVAQQVLQPLGVTPQELDYKIPSLPEHARGYLEKYSLMNVFKPLLVDREFIGNYYGRWLELYRKRSGNRVLADVRVVCERCR